MSVGLAIGLALAAFVVLLAAEMPVALALAVGGTVGLASTDGLSQTAATLASTPFNSTASYALVVIPMFVLMGVLIANARVLSDLFSFANRITRRVPGGLGVATVLSAAGFAAVTGSSAAAVATLGRLCVTEMRKHGYPTRLAAGIVAAAGTLGILIPPSIVLVIYGILTTESVGQLLIGAIIPGVITAGAYATLIALRFRFARPGDASQPRVSTPQSTRRVPAREWEAVAYVLVVFVVVLGGIYGGIFTETEAGAIGALLALIVLVVRGRQSDGGLGRAFLASARETSSVTSMIFTLLIGGGIFTFFLITARVPNLLTDWVVGLDVDPHVIVALVLLALLILGAFLDGVSILLLTIPLSYPVVTELGFSGIWFGILAVKMIEIGLLTPPFGINCYLVAGVVEDVEVEDAFRGAFPFVLSELVVVAVIFFVPDLVTWLPSISQS